MLRALTWAALGGHSAQSETRPSPVSCHRCTVFLCNHANYSKPRERPLCEHNLLFSSYFWDSRAHTLVRNVRKMLFFRFENNLWAANGLLSEPGHVRKGASEHRTSGCGTSHSHLLEPPVLRDTVPSHCCAKCTLPILLCNYRHVPSGRKRGHPSVNDS